ncbi:hypothetical protein ACS0TY_003948 [Phlomoides rotata]
MMRKSLLISTIFSSITVSLIFGAGCAAQEGPSEVEKWFEELPYATQKVTKIHFYFHDVVSGKQPTSISVAQANSTWESPSLFGLISVIDNALTSGPCPQSEIIGRAHGITGYTSSEEMCLLMTMNFVFTGGEYNGSSLTVVGNNPIGHDYREMPIVGGSNVFRLARGVATAETAQLDAISGNAVVEYNVMVLHY